MMIASDWMENIILLHLEFRDMRKECLEVPKDTTLAELKEILQDKFEVDAGKVKLILVKNCKFEVLEDDFKTLEDFNIEYMNNIFVGY